MACSLFLSLPEGATFVSAGDDELAIQAPPIRLSFRRLRPGAREALERLGNGGANQDILEGIVLQRDGTEGIATFFYQLQQLGRRSLLRRSACEEGGRLAAGHFVMTVVENDDAGPAER